MDTNYQNHNSFAKKILAAGLGWMGYTAARYSLHATPYHKGFKKYSAKHDPQDIEKSLNQVIKKYDLKCDIVDINLDNVTSLIKSMKQGKPSFLKRLISQIIYFTPTISNDKIIEIINKNPQNRALHEKILLKINPIYQIALGNDASGGYSIKVNKSKNALLGFHEAGHVYHYKNGNKLVQSLIKAVPACNKLTLLPLVLNIIVNSSDKLEENQKRKIRQIAPIAGMALFLPRFTEEILASVDGNKFAKSVCNEAMYKSVKGINRVSMAVKVLQLLSIGLGIAVSGIIPNKILTAKNN